MEIVIVNVGKKKKMKRTVPIFENKTCLNQFGVALTVRIPSVRAVTERSTAAI